MKDFSPHAILHSPLTPDASMEALINLICSGKEGPVTPRSGGRSRPWRARYSSTAPWSRPSSFTSSAAAGLLLTMPRVRGPGRRTRPGPFFHE